MLGRIFQLKHWTTNAAQLWWRSYLINAPLNLWSSHDEAHYHNYVTYFRHKRPASHKTVLRVKQTMDRHAEIEWLCTVNRMLLQHNRLSPHRQLQSAEIEHFRPEDLTGVKMRCTLFRIEAHSISEQTCYYYYNCPWEILMKWHSIVGRCVHGVTLHSWCSDVVEKRWQLADSDQLVHSLV